MIFVAWAFLQGTENLLSATLPLPSEHFRVMDVMHAVGAAQGDKPMKYFTIDTDNNITIHSSKRPLAKLAQAYSRRRSSSTN